MSGLGERLGEQFARPEGLLGALAGRIMARSNREINAWAVSLLDPQAGDRVLEVGFGPGIAAQMVLGRISEGFLIGVDSSEAMVWQARRRNVRAVEEGRASFVRADVSEMLTAGEKLVDGSFDRLLSVNSVIFWDEPAARSAELKNLLREGGLAALAVQPRTRGATEATTCEVGKDLVVHLTTAGFTDVRQEIRKMKPVPAVCALGVTPGASADKAGATGGARGVRSAGSDAEGDTDSDPRVGRMGKPERGRASEM